MNYSQCRLFRMLRVGLMILLLCLLNGCTLYVLNTGKRSYSYPSDPPVFSNDVHAFVVIEETYCADKWSIKGDYCDPISTSMLCATIPVSRGHVDCQQIANETKDNVTDSQCACGAALIPRRCSEHELWTTRPYLSSSSSYRRSPYLWPTVKYQGQSSVGDQRYQTITLTKGETKVLSACVSQRDTRTKRAFWSYPYLAVALPVAALTDGVVLVSFGVAYGVKSIFD